VTIQSKVVERMVERFADDIVDCERESDVDRLQVFQRAEFGEDARQSKPRFTQWAYMRLRGSRLSYCERNGDIVGQQGRLKTALHIGGREVPAVWATDLRVRDDWKMKGLGVALIGKLLRDYPVVLALGLSEEARKMFRRQNWMVLGRIDALLKPLSAKGFLRSNTESTWLRKVLGHVLHWVSRPLDLLAAMTVSGIHPGTRVVPIQRFDATFEPLLQRRRQRCLICCERSLEFLNWRFVDCPVASRYRSFALWTGTELRGFVVLRRAARYRKDVMYVDELVADADVLPRIIAFIIRESYRAGVDAIYYEGLGQNTLSALRKWAFFGRDSGHYFAVYSANQALRPELAERANWSLSFADSDMGFRHDR